MLALELLRRDWRAGHLGLLAAALVLVVTAVSSVGWLADRVAGASARTAAQLQASDVEVDTAEEVPDAWRAEATARGIEHARVAEFASVVLVGDRPQLVSVKAVEAGYPLRGALQLRAEPGGAVRTVRAVPPAGEVWIDPSLLSLLDVDAQGQLQLGERVFRVGALIALEPDRGGFFGSLAPRVMMNWQDLASTGLVQPASRVRYEFLLAGDPSALQGYRSWLMERAPPGLEWETPGEGRGTGQLLANAKRFLSLGALLSVLIAAVALLISVRHYASRQLDQVAIMRCLGASAGQVLRLILYGLLALAAAAVAVGAAAGFALHYLMLGFVSSWLPELPPPGWSPLIASVVTALAVLIGFVLPTVLRLRHVPPMRVLRRDLGGTLLRGSWLYLATVGVLFALIWWRAQDTLLALWIFLAVALGLGGMALVSLLLVLLLRRLRGRGVLWLGGLGRQPGRIAIEATALGVGILALLLLVVVRQDLLDAWRDRVPPDAPNYFLINVQPQEVDELREFLGASGARNAGFFPMIRGRLTHIDDRTVSPEDYAEPRAQRLVAREFNLSAANELKSDNQVVAGQFWQPRPKRASQLSVEVELAQQLGIELGDTLTFAVAGEAFTAEVTSLRRVQWDSFQANFFVIGPPALLADYPATWITSFYLPPEQSRVLPELVRRFPSVTLIDAAAVLRTVVAISEQGARTVGVMALLTLLAGALVLIAALQVSARSRRAEVALLRALGASRWRIRGYAAMEFAWTGAIAGALAGLLAALVGHFMARELFALDYPVRPALILFGAAAGTALATTAGWLAARADLRAAPMRLLRAGDH